MSQIKDLEMKLKAPFPAADIEFRITKVDKTIRKALIRSVISSRGVMDRLDDIFGCENWFDNYQLLLNGVTCKLSIELKYEFITKQDAVSAKETETLASDFSEELTRTAAKFGIGRYHLDQPEAFIDIQENKPENSQSKIHFYHSNELSGWWIEPDLLNTDPNGKDEPAEPIN